MKENFDPNNITEYESAELSLKMNRSLNDYESFLRIGDEDLKDKTILDLGSGSQKKFAEQVKARIPGAQVVSLDFNIERPGEEGDLGVVGLFSKLPFADQSFDRVVSVGAVPIYLHNRQQIQEAFLEIIRVLRKGGKAYLGPVTFTEIKSTDKNKQIQDTHEQHSYQETKEVIEGVLKKIKGINFEFLEEIHHIPRNPIPGRSKDETSVLIINKK